MTPNTGFETAGAESTADVNIETGPHTQQPEFADFNPLIGVARHD
jgi:uncharacterized protein YraI